MLPERRPMKAQETYFWLYRMQASQNNRSLRYNLSASVFM